MLRAAASGCPDLRIVCLHGSCPSTKNIRTTEMMQASSKRGGRSAGDQHVESGSISPACKRDSVVCWPEGDGRGRNSISQRKGEPQRKYARLHIC